MGTLSSLSLNTYQPQHFSRNLCLQRGKSGYIQYILYNINIKQILIVKLKLYNWSQIQQITILFILPWLALVN